MHRQLTQKYADGSLENMFHTTTSPLQTFLPILHKYVGSENIHLHFSGCEKQILTIPISTVPGLRVCLLAITHQNCIKTKITITHDKIILPH
jgi:hypothetical protein